MTSQSLYPRALPDRAGRTRHARRGSWRSIALRLAGVGLTAVTAFVASLGIVAYRFERRGALPRVMRPLAALEDAPLRDGYRAHRVELEAAHVDLSHLGQHTHANWVVFALPFDPAGPGVRNVRFAPRALRDTNVAAFPTALGCMPTPTLGPVEGRGWGEYTARGASGTHSFAEHPLAPSMETRAYAINVPTRVANAAACWNAALRERGAWRLEVSWESPDPT